MNIAVGGVFKTCAMCGKEFYVSHPGLYVYNRKRSGGRKDYYCSWHCIQDSRRDEEAEEEDELEGYVG